MGAMFARNAALALSLFTGGANAAREAPARDDLRRRDGLPWTPARRTQPEPRLKPEPEFLTKRINVTGLPNVTNPFKFIFDPNGIYHRVTSNEKFAAENDPKQQFYGVNEVFTCVREA